MLRRTIFAFVIAPIGAVITYGTLLVIDPFEGVPASLGLLGIVGLASYVAELLVAVPLFAASSRIRNAGAPAWVLGGCAVGVVVAILADLPDVNWLRWRPFAAAAAAGTASAVIFCLVMMSRPTNQPLRPTSGADTAA